MTMRNPIDGELQLQTPSFDPKKRYRYTWPGQPPKMTSGAELTELCKGADASLLSIEEASDAPAERAERSSKGESK